jgi:hypothetical protein
VLLTQEFLPHAVEMRKRYDAFMADGSQHSAHHQVFDYFFVRDTYAYLRTSADRLLGHDLVQAFTNALVAYSGQHFGIKLVTWPFISIYLNGMGQGVHNDACNGVYGYVFSLTRWDQRRFTGGETLVGKLGEFDALEPRRPRAVLSYFDSYPAHFGQLLLFDDRYPHVVPTVIGAMDPLDARVVLHGHIQE